MYVGFWFVDCVREFGWYLGVWGVWGCCMGFVGDFGFWVGDDWYVGC